jgi:hypothetical protein
MALYKIEVHKKPANFVTFWKDRNNAKAAYDYAIEEGTTIFGQAPDGVNVQEEKPE